MKGYRARRWLVVIALALVATAATTRAAQAADVNGCVERVTLQIGQAMKDATFLERVALGVLWEVLTLSCFFQ